MKSLRHLLYLVVLLATPGEVQAGVMFVAANPISTTAFATEFSTLPTFLVGPQSFDGFTFKQSAITSVVTVFNTGGGDGRGWYPNGGDSGYTEITLTSGGDFDDVGLFVGSGNPSHSFLAYELLNNNSVVSAGTLAGHQMPFHWLSITGGGFDTIRLRDGNLSSISVADGSHNALAFDKVYVAAAAATVPEPASIAILGVGALGCCLVARRKKNRA